MSFKLEKPCSEIERVEFIIKHNYENGLVIEETDECLYALEPNEVFKDGLPVINLDYEKEKLILEKNIKLQEALKKAYEAEENGTVLYKNAVFETKADNVSKLTSYFSMLQAGIIDSVNWLSKDDIQLELNKTDVIELLQTISEYTGALWNVQYLCIKEKIENAISLNELAEIKIEY